VISPRIRAQIKLAAERTVRHKTVCTCTLTQNVVEDVHDARGHCSGPVLPGAQSRRFAHSPPHPGQVQQVVQRCCQGRRVARATMRPVVPSSTTSRRPPTSEVTTGRQTSIASMATE
jgi:hypothetical protein